MKGRSLLSLLLVFGVGSQRSWACPPLCSCHRDEVDCSRRSFTSASLPTHFPPGTVQLHLQGNLLTALPNGLLDHLTSLRNVSLHGNPWACDCGVLYLRAWLVRQPAGRLANHSISCASPPSLRGRLLVYLTEEEVLDFCHYWYCDLALASQLCLFVFVVVQALLLVVLIMFLRRFGRLSSAGKRATEKRFPVGQGMMGSEVDPLVDNDN